MMIKGRMGANSMDEDEDVNHALFCFLCSPESALVFLEGANFLALGGLGPVVDGYCVIAAKSHAKSMADVGPDLCQERNEFVARVRNRLTELYGSCLITEHGRMVLCADGEHDGHCFHAHFLVFPGVADIAELARSYFMNSEKFDNLEAALAYGSTCTEYFLTSPDSETFSVFSVPLNAPRQLARYLVAWKSESPELADWRVWPQRDRALAIAESLRAKFMLDDHADSSKN